MYALLSRSMDTMVSPPTPILRIILYCWMSSLSLNTYSFFSATKTTEIVYKQEINRPYLRGSIFFMFCFLPNQDKNLNGRVKDVFYEMFHLSDDPGMVCSWSRYDWCQCFAGTPLYLTGRFLSSKAHQPAHKVAGPRFIWTLIPVPLMLLM